MRTLRVTATVVVLLVFFAPAVARGAAALLVNTESFETIDEGDGSTNIRMFFGQTLKEVFEFDRVNNRFRASRGIFVGGNVTATGSISASGGILTNANITINSDNGAADAQITFGNGSGPQTVKFLNGAQKFQLSKPVSVIGNVSGTTLNVDGNAAIYGVVKASGALKTQSGITINFNNAAQDAVLNFGNATANQTMKFLNAAQKFQLSKGINVFGNISGSTLTIDGNTTIKNITYSFPNAQGSANTFLKNDGAGNLTWGTPSVGNGSGGSIFLAPEYPHAVYFGSGSAAVGQLAYNYDSSNKENYYRWNTTKTTNQNYWTSIRVRIPKNFSNWSPTGTIQFRYRSSGGYLEVRALDTAGSLIPLTGATNLRNGSWTTASITGPSAAGTYTPESYMTILLKFTASGSTTNDRFADAGFMNLNWSTTTP